MLARGTMQSHHDEVALYAVEPRNAREKSPALEAETLEQF